MSFANTIEIAILVLSLVNLLKIAVSLIGNELFDLRRLSRTRRLTTELSYQPLVSIVIPAYNEARCITRTLRQVFTSDYVEMEVIVIDDGSTDGTSACVERFKCQGHPVKLIRQSNSGKSVAINHAVRDVASGELVMVLDADSLLQPDAVTKMVAHFRDNQVLALAANVKMIPISSWLGMVQRFEFLSAYRGKCAEDWFRNLYIIGGIGSTFRRNAMLSIGLYDTDTVTEDIDFTMKMIAHFGNRMYRIGYASDVVVYTEPVQRFKSLISQRFRWKYGRFKAFLKYRRLFFNTDVKFSKMLSWYTLPNAIFQEVFMLIEPVVFIYIQLVLLRYLEWQTYLTMIGFYAILIGLALCADSVEKWQQKVKLMCMIPMAYFGMFTLTIVDFVALMKSLVRTRTLLKRSEQRSSWNHVERL